jgi:hypothetical protein
MAKENLFDLFMVRYNAAHRGAERDVFSLLPSGDERPGICAYSATGRRGLLNPGKMPPDEPVPQAGDCYRFCLTNPHVDMVLCGPANEQHVREAIAALAAGPLDEEKLMWMRRVGDCVRGRSSSRRSGGRARKTPESRQRPVEELRLTCSRSHEGPPMIDRRRLAKPVPSGRGNK